MGNLAAWPPGRDLRGGLLGSCPMNSGWDEGEGGHLALIESTRRMAYVRATLNREQLLDADRKDDLDELVTKVREVMQETMTEGPA